MGRDFIQMLQRPDRLGADYFNDAEKQQWSQWLDAVPASAAESSDMVQQRQASLPMR